MTPPLEAAAVGKIFDDCKVPLGDWVTIEELTWHINDSARCAAKAIREAPYLREMLGTSQRQKRKFKVIREAAEKLSSELRELLDDSATMKAVSVEIDAGGLRRKFLDLAGSVQKRLLVLAEICTEWLNGVRQTLPLALGEMSPTQRDAYIKSIDELVSRKNEHGIVLFYLFLVFKWA